MLIVCFKYKLEGTYCYFNFRYYTNNKSKINLLMLITMRFKDFFYFLIFDFLDAFAKGYLSDIGNV